MLTRGAKYTIDRVNEYTDKSVQYKAFRWYHLHIMFISIMFKIVGGNLAGVTIVRTIYYNPKYLYSRITLLHELTHVLDAYTFKDGKFRHSYFKTILWYIKYTFPHNIAVLSLLWWFSPLFLLSLIFLLPMPFLCFWRRNSEFRAYYQNYRGNTGIDYTSYFTGPKYYFCDWFKDKMHYNRKYQKLIIKRSDKVMFFLKNISNPDFRM